jgi:hypothetical protein
MASQCRLLVPNGHSAAVAASPLPGEEQTCRCRARRTTWITVRELLRRCVYFILCESGEGYAEQPDSLLHGEQRLQ